MAPTGNYTNDVQYLIEKRGVFPLSQEHDLVARLSAEITGQVKILTGKILVDEEKFHGLTEGCANAVQSSISRCGGGSK